MTSKTLRQQTGLCKLTTGQHCLGQHPHSSLKMEKQSWCLPGAFTKCYSVFDSGTYSAGYKKRNINSNAGRKKFEIQSVWPVSYAGVMAQNLQGQSLSLLFDLSPTQKTEAMQNVASMTKNQILDDSESQDKTQNY